MTSATRDIIGNSVIYATSATGPLVPTASATTWKTTSDTQGPSDASWKAAATWPSSSTPPLWKVATGNGKSGGPEISSLPITNSCVGMAPEPLPEITKIATSARSNPTPSWSTLPSARKNSTHSSTCSNTPSNFTDKKWWTSFLSQCSNLINLMQI